MIALRTPSRLGRVTAGFTVALGIIALTGVVAPTAALASPTAPVPVETLHFAVTVGASNDMNCDIIGDVYRPAGVDSAHPAPAVLMTNGFGQTKDSLQPVADFLANQGYLVLAYSGLGFGGSTCAISLDDPAIDGKAASQLVSYLGGAPGIAYTDAAHTSLAPVQDAVQLDAVALDGVHHDYDPRVGMFGASYGGAVQLAAASIDPRIDALVPASTFYDLGFTLFPNHTAITSGVTSSTPGAFKHNWAFGIGLVGSTTGTGVDPHQAMAFLGCQHLTDGVCATIINGLTSGIPTASDYALSQRVSPASYISSVRAPTLVIQSEKDSLFVLNQGTASFEQLRANGVPTAMIWQWAGHSDAATAVDDFNPVAPATSQYVTGRIVNWFAHYLRGQNVPTGALFAYHRDWLPDVPGVRYAESSVFPVGQPQSYYPSIFERFETNASSVVSASLLLATPAKGVVTNADPLDLFTTSLQNAGNDQADLPGTALSWSSAVLTAPLDVVGSPTATLKVSSPTAQATQGQGPVGQLVLFLKVYDVAPNGATTLVGQQVAPVRIPDVTKPFTATMPAVVHRFDTGHRIRFSIAGSSTNYIGGTYANLIWFATGGANQIFTVPAVQG